MEREHMSKGRGKVRVGAERTEVGTGNYEENRISIGAGRGEGKHESSY